MWTHLANPNRNPCTSRTAHRSSLHESRCRCKTCTVNRHGVKHPQHACSQANSGKTSPPWHSEPLPASYLVQLYSTAIM